MNGLQIIAFDELKSPSSSPTKASVEAPKAANPQRMTGPVSSLFRRHSGKLGAWARLSAATRKSQACGLNNPLKITGLNSPCSSLFPGSKLT